MADLAASDAQPKEEWLKKFLAEEQKRADAAGMSLLEYQMQAQGGILKPTILKMLCHAKAHPKTCPPGCALQRSLQELKEKYKTTSA